MRILTTPLFNKEINLIRTLITENPKANFAINFCSLNGDTIFHYAIQFHDIKLFTFLINKYKETGVDQIQTETLNSHTKIGYNTQNEIGYSPLHLAVEKNIKSVVEILLKLKGSPNITDVLCRTPLHIAIEKKHLECVKLLLSRKEIDINAATLTGQTPISLAIEQCNDEIIELLLESGVKINTEAQNKSILNLAVKNKNIKVIELLLQRGVKIDTYAQNKSVLYLATIEGNKDIVSAVLNKLPEINYQDINGNTPLHLALLNNQPEIALLLIDRGANPKIINKERYTPLRLAILNNQPEIAFLLTQKANNHSTHSDYRGSVLHLALKMRDFYIAKNLINMKIGINEKDINGHDPLYLAINFNNTSIVSMLLNNGAIPNKKHLHTAIVKGKANIIQLLINHGADINEVDEYGIASLHLAVEKGFAEIIKMLITHNVKIDHQDIHHGNTALHLSIINHQTDIVELLTSKGANPDIRNNDNYSAIHLAILLGAPKEVLMMLLRNKEDVNAKDQDGNTLLHLAIMDRNGEAIKALIENGANPYIYNKECTSLDLAIQNGAPEEVLEMLVDTKRNINNFDQDGNTLLHKAIWSNNIAAVKLLIEKGANPEIEDRHKYSAIHLAISRNGTSEIISALISNKKNINYQHPNRDNCNTLLHLAILNNNFEAVKALLQKGANPDILNKDDYSAIHLAIMQRAPADIMDMLLDRSNNLNFVDKLNNSYLHIAILFRATDIAKLLLQKGINYRLKNSNNENAITAAINSGYTEIIIAINHQVTINANNKPFAEREINRRFNSLQQERAVV